MEHCDNKFNIFQVSNGTILGHLLHDLNIQKKIIANVLLKEGNWEKK